jgi:hypothetical protein
MSASRGIGAARTLAPNAGVSATAADADRKPRRVIVMSWFPELEGAGNNRRTLPHLMLRSNHHGESIMIDPLAA